MSLFLPKLSIVLVVCLSSQVTEAVIGEQINWFQIQFCEDVNTLEFVGADNTGELIAKGFAADRSSGNGVIHYYKWNLLDGSELQHVPIDADPNLNKVKLRQVAWGTEKKLALITSDRHDVVLFDTESLRVLAKYSGHRRETKFAAFSPNFRNNVGQLTGLVAVVDTYNKIWFWDAAQPELPLARVSVPKSVSGIEIVDEKTVRVFMNDAVGTYSIEDNERISWDDLETTLDINGVGIEPITFSSGREHFLSKEKDTLHFRNRLDGSLVWEHSFGRVRREGWPEMPNSPWSYVFSENDECVATSVSNSRTYIFSKTGEIIDEGQWNAMKSYLKFSKNGKYLVSAGSCNISVYKAPIKCQN